MSTAKSNRGRDRGMPQQNLINLMWRDILSSADDDVFDSAGQMQVAVRIKVALIAGAKPSVDKGMSVGVGIIFVSPKNIRALNRDLASLVGAEMFAVFIHNADTQANADSDRSGLSVLRRQGIGSHLVRGFRHAIRFHERYAEKPLDLMNELGRQRRAARPQESQGCGFHRLAAAARQQ